MNLKVYKNLSFELGEHHELLLIEIYVKQSTYNNKAPTNWQFSLVIFFRIQRVCEWITR